MAVNRERKIRLVWLGTSNQINRQQPRSKFSMTKANQSSGQSPRPLVRPLWPTRINTERPSGRHIPIQNCGKHLVTSLQDASRLLVSVDLRPPMGFLRSMGAERNADRAKN